MQVVNPCVYVQSFDPARVLKNIELAGRVCYKSEDKIAEGSAERFIQSIVKHGHESVLEHEKLTVKFVTDRATANQIVRHRLASYSQESTRYCNYTLPKFGQEITVIRPVFSDNKQAYNAWYSACERAERSYFVLMSLPGITPEHARSVLPHSLKTELFMTANIREWRHVLKLRASSSTHPETRRLMIPLLLYLKKALPPLFSDIPYDTEFPASLYAKVRSLEDGSLLLP